jgi:hypothetical protein
MGEVFAKRGRNGLFLRPMLSGFLDFENQPIVESQVGGHVYTSIYTSYHTLGAKSIPFNFHDKDASQAALFSIPRSIPPLDIFAFSSFLCLVFLTVLRYFRARLLENPCVWDGSGEESAWSEPAAESPGVLSLGYEAGRVIIKVGSGRYIFETAWKR